MYWQNYIDRRWLERSYYQDINLPVPYPRYHGDGRVIKLSELREIQWLRPGCDLVEWTKSPEKEKRFIFKFGVARETFQRVWTEMKVLERLQEAEAGTELVSFPTVHRLVVDDFDSSILGFTSSWVRKCRTFSQHRGGFPSLWVDELIKAVDDLHWKFDIFHNDINPANVLVDEDTGNIIITGFGLSRPCDRNFSKMDYRRHLSDIDVLCVTIYETLCAPGEYTRRVKMQGNQIFRGRIYNTHELLRTEWDVKAPLAQLLTDEYEIRTKLRE
ncbi:hypothetical protein VTN00DRAFT_9076 [Thermoascus crustaceus]|uniref:uncharacterized protein n=1 Tax=Thermoascus crustaceus TaxID=5088 RepID=UPI003743E2FB